MGLKCILQGQELQPSDTLPKSPGTAAIGSSTLYARADHVHPQDDTKLDKSGGTMTGSLVLNNDPTENLEAATKQYVDNHSGGDGSKIGDIKITARTDLGDNWLLCNGAECPSDATELSTLMPQNEYPFSTFDILSNLSSSDSVYDIFNSTDGKIYVLANSYNDADQQRQYIFQISPSDGVLRKLETSSIPSFLRTGTETYGFVSSIFVDDNKIYLFGMPGKKSTKALPIVVYGDFTGEEFPTTWNTVEIPLPSSYNPLNTYSTGSMGKRAIFRIVNGKYYFLVYCYNYYEDDLLCPFLVSDTLGGATTSITIGEDYNNILFIDSDNYLYLVSWSSYLYLRVIKNGELIKTGTYNIAESLSRVPWIIRSGNYIYCYTLDSSAKLFALTYEKGSSADIKQTSESSKARIPIIQWGEKTLAYGEVSDSEYPVYQITQPPMKTINATGKSAPESALPKAFQGGAFHEGDYYFSIKANDTTNNKYTLRLIIPKNLPTITFDNAYAYIKAKEETT